MNELREKIREGTLTSPFTDPRSEHFSVSVPLETIDTTKGDFNYDCFVITSIPGMYETQNFEIAMECVQAIRQECEWGDKEIWIDREVFGKSFIRSDWKDHWNTALGRAQRGLIFMSPISHTPNLEWEFDRMNETFRSEDIIYVILDQEEDSETLHYVRAYANAQGSAVFNLRDSTLQDVARYFNKLSWSWARTALAPRLETPTPQDGSPYKQETVTVSGPQPYVVYTLDSVLSKAECESLIHEGNQLGFQPAPVCYHHSASTVLNREVKNHSRVYMDREDLAATLFRRLKAHLPGEMKDGSKLVGFNERIRWLKYLPGESVSAHQDGAFTRESGERSVLTILLYLNEDYEGGETEFYASWTAADSGVGSKAVPRQGRACVMQHDVLHAGLPVATGTKYCLRIEVMYEAPGA